jgi:hypothetical protein
VFAVIESSVGHSLPLFVENSSKEALITAPQEIFQMLFYLLIHDFVKGKKGGICNVSCENHGDKWDLHLKFSYPDTPLVPANKAIAPVSNFEGLLISPREKDLEGGNLLLQDTIEGSVMQERETITTPIPSLVNDEIKNDDESTTSMERLSDRILTKYLHIRPIKHTSEMKDGIHSVHKIIPLNRSFCTITEKNISFANGIPGDRGGRDGSNGNTLSPSGTSVISSFYHDKVTEIHWILLCFKFSETGLIPYIKDKFKNNLFLSITIMTIEDYKNLLYSYQHHHFHTAKNIFFILPESHLIKFNNEIDLTLIKNMGKEVIIICDKTGVMNSMTGGHNHHNNNNLLKENGDGGMATLGMLNNRYDINASYLLKAKPTLLELLTCIKVSYSYFSLFYLSKFS